ncbi:MAG: arsenate reductase ArsC [Bdellovibrionales bacterium]
MNILFLCTGNSARSIVGEILLRDGYRQHNAYSAGSKPTGKVNPLAIKILKQHGHNVENVQSQNCLEYAHDDAPIIDVVISVCANAEKECAIWPGKSTPERLHWPLPDPENEEDFEKVYSALKKKLAEKFA